LSADYNLASSLGILLKVITGNAGIDLDCWAFIYRATGTVARNPLSVGEMMHPDGESSCSGRFPHIAEGSMSSTMPRLKHNESLLVAGVLDDKTNIMLLSKCKCSDDMLRRRDIDRIFDIIPNGALIIDWGEWIAALVEEYRCHDGRWIFFAV